MITDQIQIKATGYCENCPHMKLELNTTDTYCGGYNYKSEYKISCKRAAVCQMWENHMVKAYTDWNKGVKK